MESLDAIVLAGGLGTRLRSVIDDRPKVLAPVNGKPFIEILFNLLNRHPLISRVVIAAGYRADELEKKYAGSAAYGFNIVFSVETEPLGTGGAIKKAISQTASKDILVLNGDSYLEIDLARFYSFHQQKNALTSIAIKKTDDANRYGTVRISDDGRIQSFEEKALSGTEGFINAGMYLFDRTLFDHVAENEALSLEKDLLPRMIRSRAYGFIAEGKFIDIGIPESYNLASTYLKDEN